MYHRIMIKKVHYWLDWLCRDLTTRKGSYVIVEAPNAWLIAFMISLIIGVVVYPGLLQKILLIIAYVTLSVWGWKELRTGRSNFRRVLGGAGIVAAIVALILWLTG